MKSHLVTLLAAVVVAALIGACGGDDSPTDTGGGGGGGTFTGTVSVRDNFFSPANVTIAVGDSVTWSFDGSNIHTVTEGAPGNPTPLFNSGNRNSGTFGYRFTTAGTYPYHCIPHAAQGMIGSVKVEP